MTEHTSVAAAPPLSLTDRHYFLLRRLHSLTGIVPIGVFVIEHMLTNSAIALGPEHYQSDVNFIWNLPALLMLEIFGIWVPLGFHAALGVVYTFTGRPNSVAYPYGDNHRYTLMRVTGMIALVYILFHLSSTRWGWSWWGLGVAFDPTEATLTTAQALQVNWWMPWFYLVGTLAVVFHFANGLWTAAITWGITTTPTGFRRWGYICAVLGIVLALMGIVAIYHFSVYDIANHAAVVSNGASAAH